MTRFLTYRRLSYRESYSQSVSLSWQAEQCAAYIARHKDALSLDFVDDGVSGSVPLGKRDGGRRLLAEIAKGDCVVVIAKLDRMFRSTADAAMTAQQWLSQGVGLVSVCEGFDYTTIGGRLIMHILSAVAQAERETIALRVAESTKARRRLGLRVGGPVPYGFRAVDTPDGKAASGEVVRIVRDEGEQKVIEKMRDLRRRGLGWKGIAKRLEEDGIPTRTGRPWMHMTVKGILTKGKFRSTKRRPAATSNGEGVPGTEGERSAGGEDS